MIGLKRGTVKLCEHELEWETEAQNTIYRLKKILGSVAKDIQHIGSTSISSIKAKPIIDIAVAVDNFDDILAYEKELKKEGFYYRPNAQASIRNQLLFACGNYYEGTGDLQTHFIHIVLTNSMDWLNYINFRDYLNNTPSVAKEYEELKLSLALQAPIDSGREKYLNGKHDFIVYTLRKALVKFYLGKTVDIEIDRPIGFIHKKDNYSLTYPINYGYIPSVIGGDGEELDVYLLGVSEPVKKYSAKIIGIVHRHNDTEDKLVAAPEGVDFTAEQISDQIRFQEQYYEVHIETINNIAYHYDTLIDQDNDPVHDPEPLKAYMDKWDGDSFIGKLCLEENKKVLEIGVGTGRLAVKTAPLCKEFYGIDISPKTAQRAKENLVAYKNVNLICGDFIHYDFGKTFDVIYSSLTFMHIEDKLKAMCKVFDLLSDGGIFVLSIDKNQDEFIDIGTSKIKIFPDTPENIVCCLNKVGFHLSEQFETEFAHIFVAKKYYKCYCGHDCSKCVTYIATKTNNNVLREQAKSFYKNEFSQDIPLESFNCFGGRTENQFVLCDSCPFKKCCKEKNIAACDQCSNYPCNMLEEYQKKYVNKCNQINEK